MSTVDEQLDAKFMTCALALAQRAYDLGEVPVGAVLVKGEKIIGEGWNQPITTHDATAHAEIVAIRNAAQQQQNYRLPSTTLYVTVEPCTMCVGAVVHARVERLVFGTIEPKAGAVTSRLQLLAEDHWNHNIVVQSGVLAKESAELIKAFFKMRREQKREFKKGASYIDPSAKD